MHRRSIASLRPHRLLPLAALAALAAPAAGQVPPLEYHEVIVPDVIVNQCGAPQAGDVDGDGWEDIYWVDLTLSRAVAGDGLGGFTLLGGGTLPHGFSAGVDDGDMDGDGRDDLVVVGGGQDAYVYRSLGNGSFELVGHGDTGDDPNGTLAADLDDDGDLDVAAVWGDALFSAGVRVFRNHHRGAIELAYEFIGPYDRLNVVEAADIDGDGLQDLVVSVDESGTSAALLFRGIGDAAFDDPVEIYTVGKLGFVARVADLDNDGWVDLVISRSPPTGTQPPNYLLEALMNEGGGVFGPPVPAGTGRVDLLSDLNGDGRIDAVVTLPGHDGAASTSEVRLARGLGDGTFLPSEAIGHTMTKPFFCGVGRLDQNLSWELFAGDSSTKDVHVLINDQPGSPYATASPPLSGSQGEPRLWGTGATLPGSTVRLTLSGAKPSAPLTLIVGTTLLSQPFKGGLLGPAPLLLFPGLATSPTGNLTVMAPWPGGIPLGAQLHVQAWIVDAAAVQGLAASNTLSITAD